MTFPPPPPKRLFAKPWCSRADQLALLQARGLNVLNRMQAEAFLDHINYYRFSGYCLAFEQARHQFSPGVTFEQIRAAYEFDRILRDLVTEALEVIEEDLRSAMAYHFSRQYGPFGHINGANFYPQFGHQEWLDKLHGEAERSSEEFVRHFATTYLEFPDLPIWTATEIMSFGALSQMFCGMDRRDQRVVASRYAVQARVMASWMHHLVYVRNLCAHHSRLWDRIWSIKPTLPAGAAWKPPRLWNNSRLLCTLLILRSMLKGCPATMPFTVSWRQRMQDLLDVPPMVSNALALMGLAPDWREHPCWI